MIDLQSSIKKALIASLFMLTACGIQHSMPSDWQYIDVWDKAERGRFNYPTLQIPVPPGMYPGPSPAGTDISMGPGFDKNRKDAFIVIINKWEGKYDCQDSYVEEKFIKNTQLFVEKIISDCVGHEIYKVTIGKNIFHVKPLQKKPNTWPEKWILTSLLNARIVDEE